MILSGVGLALPSRLVLNDYIVDQVAVHSAARLGDQLDEVLEAVRELLERSGARTRYWLDDSESPLVLVSEAVDMALHKQRVSSADVDVIIYVGVDRVLVEPANAYLIARELGMNRAECFDVLDGCNSWIRAVQIADALFQAGSHQVALIISAEFGVSPGGPAHPGLFSLESPSDLEWKFAGLTLGEAATATVVRAGSSNPWEFLTESRPDLVDLCSVPVTDPRRYGLSDRVGRAGNNMLTSFGSELFTAARPHIRSLLDQSRLADRDVKALFVHAAASRPWFELANELGVDHLVHNVYPHLGNVVTSSIPAAIARAVESGSVAPGDEVQVLVGSAGMVFTVTTFRL